MELDDNVSNKVDFEVALLKMLVTCLVVVLAAVVGVKEGKNIKEKKNREMVEETKRLVNEMKRLINEIKEMEKETRDLKKTRRELEDLILLVETINKEHQENIQNAIDNGGHHYF